MQLDAQSPSQEIKALEYFIGSDPGPGNGNTLVISANPNINETFSITVPSLSSGFHNLFIRAKDQNNSWSIAQRSEFYVPAPLPQNIVKLQYYFDTDPGVGVAGNGSILSVTPGSNLNQTIAITTQGSLTSGYHNLFTRTQNDFGVWSIAERRPFGIGTCVSIPDDDIISWWSFDEASENVVADISGNHDGVLVNGATTRLYFELDGSSKDYIGVPDSDDWAFGTKDFSIEFFANFLSPGGDVEHPEDKFIGQSEGGGVAKKWTFALGDNKLFFRVSNGSISQNLVQSNFAPVLNQWYHLAITRKADTLKTYINGQLASSQVVAGLSIPNVNAPLTIGAVDWVQGMVRYMDGKLDEMTIYKRALTQQEITSISNAGAGGKCKSIQITTPAISDAQYGTAFSQTLEAALGNTPYVWSVSAGELPEGITLSTEGVLSGITTEAGEFAFTIQAKDANDVGTQKDFVMKVLLTLPEPQFSIFKSGTVPVPGRESDYFILVKNEGTSYISSVAVHEFLQFWFTYIESEPSTEIISKMPNIYTLNNDVDSLPAMIRWVFSLQAEESKLLTYKVKLQPHFPVADTVIGGEACTAALIAYEECYFARQDACRAEQYATFREQLEYCQTNGTETDVECLDIAARIAQNLTDECIRAATLDIGICPSPHEACARDRAAAAAAKDPNEKLVLAEKYIQPDKLLPYVIHFENIGTIEARDIFITDTLDEDLDETTLNIITPGGIYNPVTRVLKWNLYNYNLLPDSGAYVMYTAKPKPNLPSGTVIHNTAQIQFEVFDIFTTNETENIIDYTDPEGVMNALSATMYQTAFPISWSGMDAVGEINNYSIFVSKNGDGYELFLSKTQNTSAIFTGETGNTYRFICIAEDLAGNIEVQEPIAESTTHLDVLCTEVYYYDADNDGYGNSNIPTTSCSQPTGFVINSTDCNDSNVSINPGATEICNFIDDDCDGLKDEGVTTTFYQDADTDGFGTSTSSVQRCNQPTGYVTNGNDCNDANASVNLGATEICNSIDDDCDGLTDEGVTTTFYLDTDTDGFGNPDATISICNQPSGYVTNGNDCDDSNSNVNLDAHEINDGIDNDCDGLVDEGFSDMSVDAGNCAKVYGGYDPAGCTVLTVNVEDGSAPFTYLWNNGVTTQSTTVCPVVTTTYTVTVTDNTGVSANDVVTVHVIDIRCGNNNDKVKVCHGSSNNNLCIAPAAVQSHLDHGDQLGICNATNPCGSQALVNEHIHEATKNAVQFSQRSSKIKRDEKIYFSIKPNPANNHIEIQTNLTSAFLSIMDVSGRVIIQERVTDGRKMIDTGSLLDGIYFVRLENGVDCNVKKLVLMH